jgi:hypothetical protein
MAKPPNYRRGSLKGRHCSNCGAYRTTAQAGRGFCRMFSVPVGWLAVCDRWYRRGSA